MNLSVYKLISLLFPLFLGTGFHSSAQYFLVSKVYNSTSGEDVIYSIVIRNSSHDSIMVLHTQEAELPPFINLYKWEKSTSNEKEVTLFLGKSNNPFLPEKYRATKTLAPKGVLELYFSMPSSLNLTAKQLMVYYSMLDQKYLSIFQSLETTGTNRAFKKCKSLKEKKGVVFHRLVSF